MKHYRFAFLVVAIAMITACSDTTAPSITAISSPTLSTRISSATPTITKIPSRTPASLKPTDSQTLSPTPEITDPPKEVVKTQLPSSIPTEYHSYIGMVIPPMPPCCILEGAGFIEGQEKFGVAFVTDKENIMVWSLLYEDGSKQTVLDILIIPKLGEMDIISANYCRVNGETDPYIVTINTLDREAVNTRFFSNDKIQKAWRINSSTGTFLEISTGGIECVGEGGFDPNNVIYKLTR